MRTLITSMTLVILPPHVLGPKYERRQRPRNSQEFRIGRSRGNLAMTPDVAVVISLNRFWAPADDTVTALSKTQVTSHKYEMNGTVRLGRRRPGVARTVSSKDVVGEEY